MIASKNVLWIVITGLVLYILFHVSSWNTHLRFQESHHTTKRKNSKSDEYKDLKIIIYWNDFFTRYDYLWGYTQVPFVEAGCEYDMCYATSNRSMFAEEDYDAVVFHPRESIYPLPKYRSQHTRYISYMVDPLIFLSTGQEPYEGFYNYTMYYHPDSTVPVPYGAFRKLDRRLAPLNINFAAEKTKLAVVMMSHCGSPGNRDNVIAEMKKYMPVDIIGGCGDTPEPDGLFDLRYKIQRIYKFYLAFENSLCDKYITEKYYYNAKLNFVPVTYGIAPYDEMVPPKSYINVLDFDSIKKLTEYLLYLDGNDTAYNEYFEYKRDYVQYDPLPWCEICKRLHTDTETQIIKDPVEVLGSCVWDHAGDERTRKIWDNVE